MENSSTAYWFGSWLIEPHLNRISNQASVHKLEPRTMDVLICLLERVGHVVATSELLDLVWSGSHAEPHMVAKRVSQIRKVLQDDPRAPRFIATVSKRGYRVIATVKRVDPSLSPNPSDPGPPQQVLAYTPSDVPLSISKPVSARDILAAHSTTDESEDALAASMPGISLAVKRMIPPVSLAVLLMVGVIFLTLFVDKQLKEPSTTQTLRSIAVLPLDNFSGDPAQQYIADGMTEEIITELGKLEQLQVVSRSSVMRYRKNRPSIKEIAKALDVSTIIEGSVTREGGRIRVTVQLIDALEDSHIWANSFDNDTTSVLALRSNVAREIALHLGASVDDLALGSYPTITDEAYDAYLQGLSHMGPSEKFPLWVPEATREFKRALALQPDFAEAWGHLALIEVINAVWVDRDNFAVVKDYAEKALAINSRLAIGHTAMGYFYLLNDWDIPAADAAFQYALELSPGDPRSLQGYLNSLRVREHPMEALHLSRRLLASYPNDPQQRSERIRYFYSARLYEQVIHEANIIRQSEPGFHSTDEAAAYFRLGRFTESHHARVAAYRFCGARCDGARLAIERGWDEAGYEGSIRALAELAFQENERGPHWFLAQLGDMDAALSNIERQIDKRLPWLVGARYHPAYDSMHLSPNFDDILMGTGLPKLDEHPARIADVAGMMAFRGQAQDAISMLNKVILNRTDDARFPRWLGSMAWAQFAVEDYSQATIWAGQVLEYDPDMHGRAFAKLLIASSYANMGKIEASKTALREAQTLWPGELDFVKDLQPFFLGGDMPMYRRFRQGLESAGLISAGFNIEI